MEIVLGLVLISAVIGAYALVRPSLITHVTASLFMAILGTSAQSNLISYWQGPAAPILQWGLVGFASGLFNLVSILFVLRRMGDYFSRFTQRERPFWATLPRLPGNRYNQTYTSDVDNPPSWSSKLLRRQAVANAEKHNRKDVDDSANNRGWNYVERP